MSAPRPVATEPAPPSGSKATTLFGTVLIFAVIATGALSAWSLRLSAENEWREFLSNLSLVLAEKTRQNLVSASLVMDAIVERVRANNVTDAATLRDRLQSRETHELLHALIGGSSELDVATIVDDKGDVVSFSRSFPTPKINIADRDYFKARRANPELGIFVSEPVKNRGNGRWTFYLSRRLEDRDGRFIGLLLVGVSCESMSAAYERISLGEGSRVALFRDDWVLLTRSPLDDKMQGVRYPESGVAAALGTSEKNGQAGVIVTDSDRISIPHARDPRMVAARRVDGFPMVLGVVVERDIFLARWNDTAATIGVVTTASVIGLIVAFAILYRIQRRRDEELAQTIILKEHAESANRVKTEFLANMSHELRTPLQGVLGFSELLAHRGTEPFARECAGHIQSSAIHLLGVLNNILDLAKVEAGMVELHFAPHDVRELLERVVALHRAAALVKGIDVTLEIGDSVPGTAFCDATVLEQILNNLLSNAVKFTETGTVRVVASHDGDRLRCEVIDSGPGIPPELHETIFEKFRQGEQFLTRRHGGTGLGLALVRDLVTLCGGRVWLASAPDLGSTFSFEIPAGKPS